MIRSPRLHLIHPTGSDVQLRSSTDLAVQFELSRTSP